MKNSWMCWGTLGICLLLLNGCGEDEIPKSTIEFDQEQHDGGELSVYESNGGVTSFHPLLYQDENGNTGEGLQYEIEINLNRPVAETTVIRFSTNGTATRSTATEVGDYDILSDGELLVIEKGESSVSIVVEVYEDYDFEVTQTEVSEIFTIELEEVISGTGKLGEFTTFDFYIYEDDTYIQLTWEPQDAGTADLNAFLWADGELDYGVDYSTQLGENVEIITIPGGYPSVEYGLSYTYKTGTSTDVDIEVYIANLGGNLNGNPNDLTFTENYSQNNLNDYTVTDVLPHIAQTLDKSGFNYTSLGGIQKNPNGGSRMVPSSEFSEKLNLRKPVSRFIRK